MNKKGWGFDTRDIDSKVRPQDDFFHYASGGWMQKNPIPKTESRWGSFTELRHTTDKQLNILLKKVVAKKHAGKGSPEQMIRDLYSSGMDLKKRKALGISPLKKQLALIEKILTPEDMVRTIAHLEREGLSAGAWGSGIDQDMKNSEKYIIYLGQGGLGMPDRDYYLKDDAESKRVRKAYEIHLTRLGELAGSKEAKKRAATMIELETALAKASMKKEDLRDVDKTYHKKTFAQLQKLTPRIDWKEYFEIIGTNPKEVVVMQPDFFIAVEKMFYSFPIESWKTYPGRPI